MGSPGKRVYLERGTEGSNPSLSAFFLLSYPVVYLDRVPKGSPEGMPMAEYLPLRFFLLSYLVVYLERVPKSFPKGCLYQKLSFSA